MLLDKLHYIKCQASIYSCLNFSDIVDKNVLGGIYLKKFSIGLVMIVLASVIIFPASVSVVKAESYSKEMPVLLMSNNEITQSIYDADHFNTSAHLAKRLQSVADAHSLSYDEMHLYGTKELLDSVKKRLDEYRANRNELSRSMKAMSDPDAVKVLSMHHKAINSYETANTYLKKYYNSPTQYNLKMYLKYDENAYNLSLEIESISRDRYFYHLSMALNALE